MRKLGILLTVMVAATLGYSGTASAQQAELCDSVLGGIAEQADANDPSGNGGAPIGQSAAGAQESCNQSFENQTVMPSPLLCGVAEGLDIGPGGTLDGMDLGTTTAGAINDGAVDQPVVDDGTLPTDFEKCAGAAGDDDDDDDTKDDDDVKSAVKQNNAAGDGSLPRTGGELFAGAGFGLMSLGALVRRFLP